MEQDSRSSFVRTGLWLGQLGPGARTCWIEEIQSWAGLLRVGFSDPRDSGLPRYGSRVWREEGRSSQWAARECQHLQPRLSLFAVK